MRKNTAPRFQTYLDRTRTLSQTLYEIEQFDMKNELKVKVKKVRRESFVPCQECDHYIGYKKNGKEIWKCKVGFPNCIHTGQVTIK